jgi:hypothetical protein
MRQLIIYMSLWISAAGLHKSNFSESFYFWETIVIEITKGMEFPTLPYTYIKDRYFSDETKK